MVKASEMEGVEVPKAMEDAVNRTLASVEQLQTQLPQFLSLSDPQLLSQLPPLQRAHTLFCLAKITSTLFSLKLRCRGLNPRDHPIKSQFERLRLYQNKLEHLMDLSEGQRQDMRNISGGEEQNGYYQEQAGQKRKYLSCDDQYVQTAANEFQKKATGENLGDNNGSTKEPIVIDISDDDDDDELLEP